MTGTGDSPRLHISYHVVGREVFMCLAGSDQGHVRFAQWVRIPSTPYRPEPAPPARQGKEPAE